jgi:threonyl-tRNA synthetase
VRVLTIGEEDMLVKYAQGIVQELRAHMVRAEGDYTSDKINGKIQRSEQAKVHTMLVVGPRDLQGQAVSVRVHGKGSLGARPKTEVVAQLLADIGQRAAN